MAISPQRLTIYLYSAHRAVICDSTAFLFNHVNVCSCACKSANIQQQESRAVAGVLGLEFANIIH